MATQIISALVEGGKANAGPPLGPALGPSGLNLGEVIAKINEKTKSFSGMQVPVKVIYDSSAKTFEVEVGTPPVSALVKKELGLKEPVKEEAGKKGKPGIGNLSVEQVVNIAKAKQDAMTASSLRAAVKEVAGTCQSLGATIDGKNPKQFCKLVDAGEYDAQLA
ncbi:50S ribosomal protein L11 [Candidatus Micrarchaeota archaeon CG10_big_fil_rev_8_21_14_0_10_54_18]|nr:MAG: 50S ribosomal protein L11 [Candidatus Micrarchaeota archaeon CG1_02_55_41]PIO02481.1 MAG: 50S ribosomal protein L11 [Candidatus Micrarchaeota archaeon CG09_land_8_20_14_0_10_55_25]PJD00963.1 MAG: 50S ribosomal protein L11 [Candidatus Micrarchaeota archaeon CG10_big_fil_rev_8_21_14_0_10_54_18]